MFSHSSSSPPCLPNASVGYLILQIQQTVSRNQIDINKWTWWYPKSKRIYLHKHTTGQLAHSLFFLSQCQAPHNTPEATSMTQTTSVLLWAMIGNCFRWLASVFASPHKPLGVKAKLLLSLGCHMQLPAAHVKVSSLWHGCHLRTLTGIEWWCMIYIHIYNI